MEACNEIHSAEESLFQLCHFLQSPQLIQQNDLGRKGPQRHLKRPPLWQARDHVKGLARPVRFRKKLLPFVHHGNRPSLSRQAAGYAAQEGGFAAVRLPHQDHPCKPGVQRFPEGRRQGNLFPSGDPQIERADRLNHHPLLWMEEKFSRHPHPVSPRQSQVSFRQFLLMGVDRPAAEGVKRFFHLRGGQNQRLKLPGAPRNSARRAGPSGHRKAGRTALPETNLMDPAGCLGRKRRQRPGNPPGQALRRLIKLVHFSFPRISRFAAPRTANSVWRPVPV